MTSRFPAASAATFTGLGDSGQASPNSRDSVRVTSGRRSPTFTMARILVCGAPVRKSHTRQRVARGEALFGSVSFVRRTEHLVPHVTKGRLGPSARAGKPRSRGHATCSLFEALEDYRCVTN